MIQFFRFDRDLISENKFLILSGSKAKKFFAKKILLMFVLIYSIFFIPVALPFVKIPFVPAYFIISFVAIVYFFRLMNNIVKFFAYQNGGIIIDKESITISSKLGNITIPADSITFLEYNILGNLVIRTGRTSPSYAFPLLLLDANKTAILSMFGDLSPKRTIINKKIWEFCDAVGVALFLAVHIIQFVVQAYFIPTGSMEDTLLVGDHLFVEKVTYGPIIPQMVGMKKPKHLNFLSIRDVKRGDIVIFRPPHENDKDYIKRCIAIPGDDIAIKDGYVYINGTRLNEPYVKGKTFDDFEASKVQGIVPKGQVVVLGDNRENSMDGRYFGLLDIEKIRGRAFILYWNTGQIRQFNFSRLGLIY